jgi:hypothetical protein
MRKPTKRKLFALVLIGIIGTFTGRIDAIPLGEDVGPIRAYDPASKSVKIGDQPVNLSPAAAASLERQLGALRLTPGQEFGARYIVRQDVAGSFVIDSIFVYPPRRR